ncbi:MAG TPA: FISUMP domain-containing protein [Atopostipes sp.]|nr:FISUMP domain-containing protein [Atopostipes sp.]
MKVKASIVLYAIIMGLLLVFSYSCEKDESNESKGAAGTFTDKRDGNVYKFVTIGDQVWMAENLKYLPEVVGPTIESWRAPCYYVYGYYGTNVKAAKSTANYSTYGVLYNWPAAMGGSISTANLSGVQGVCPKGWHLPRDAEWKQLTDYLGGDDVAGGKLKENGTAHWYSPNIGATNEKGFTALPGGDRDSRGFYGIGGDGCWWSASEGDDSALCWYMFYDYSVVIQHEYDKEDGYSVRCVRD